MISLNNKMYRIDRLLALGLSPYESKCYIALVTQGNMLGKEVAKVSGVPPTSIYRNLETLRLKGFVSIVQKEPLVFQAVEPEIAISTYVKSRQEKLIEIEKKTIKELNSIKKIGVIESDKKEEVLEVYSGREQSYKLGKVLIKKAKKELCLIGKGTDRSILDLIHGLKAAVKRGVDCKFILTEIRENKNQNIIDELKKAGIKMKYLPLSGFSLLIKDSEESQIVIKDKKLKEERIVLNIKNKELSRAHSDYFETMWKKAMPV
ncbi:TrmB family transcriptional regulator [Candidatus Woesearchaeota archaeon]|jgi:sugar-specific transcriptional regulator TrmB|nr:TrmB family transcriptional regulator [Candidatus Woesearchaeota archaeon]MBT6520117.1 TrmB family transcriptional regulator [Candidatus Woesearchaeota archaeon]MBT7366722.1 TrmB family transcriptional regulator [Candidatus Woesearchaeota archaeon]